MNLIWRIPPNFLSFLLRHWTEHELLLCVWQRQNKCLAGWLVPPIISIKTQSHTLLIYTDFFSIWLCFQHRIRDLFHTDQYERWRVWKPGLLCQSFNDLGSNDMLMCFSPHTVCSGRFMRLAVVLYRIRASVLWERCSELMLEICRLLWVFFFSFQALLLTLFFFSFWDPFCCWITLHSWRNNGGHIARVVWSSN